MISCAKRQWLEISEEQSNEQQSNYELKIMQYNVLAPCYTYSSLFPNCTKKDIEWERRLDLIDTLFDLTEKLKNCFHFSAIHRIKGKSKQDGCTTIFNLDEFEEVYSAKLDLDLSNNSCQELRWINCENICLFTLLKRKNNPDQYILVGNTHFIYSPQMGIVKLGQAKLITSAIHSILQKESNKNIDVFLCGDFNFIPNSAVYSFLSEQSINFSGLPLLEVSNQKFAYMFEKNEQTMKQHFQKTTCKYDFQNKQKATSETLSQFQSLVSLDVNFDPSEQNFTISQKNDKQNIGSNIITSDFNLKSAYAEFYKQYYQQNPNSKKSLVNNLISELGGKQNLTFEYGLSHLTMQGYLQCDFIWYNLAEPIKNKSLKSILQQHDYSYVNSFKAFPNKCHPSDHFPIVATFNI